MQSRGGADVMLRSNRRVCGMGRFQVTQSQHIAQKVENCISSLLGLMRDLSASPLVLHSNPTMTLRIGSGQ
ncbi:hypothetical protein HBI56_132170 [Parastagonospora nodorum]|uniref:Uncharacterized protein n=1 Tax=Phaeosphaeria nodorum (strain SN15 / ATCC MYA-4574 / FGSC 10173) TaxID=321614 RepID=A0A7U2F031_PHANO|nr:hypothetical protein HBH56_151660 [Parastagonospora nodorum]QRC96152.1 hypothetical protein JI435_408340 [Parastagonospora nodorum SN15]KAH3926542.1 hypothetical protein HBH54_166040 [Parastagonospora nodorum]KAH3940354.1 hypothetical protein HBH53_219010 [Parastagonospora nodorum]KAH3970380.1 hypothetical protein HBH52_164810 [Parastagonospora nodorum]